MSEQANPAIVFSHLPLNPIVADAARDSFVDGSYEMAVICGYKKVIEAVRRAGNISEKLDDIALMRFAFNNPNGPLYNEFREQEPDDADLSDLFAATMGAHSVILADNGEPILTRNISEMSEAIELLFMYSYLLRKIESVLFGIDIMTAK